MDSMIVKISAALKYAFVALIIVIFITPADWSDGAYVFAAVPLALASLFIFTGMFKGMKYDKKSEIISAALTVLFLLQLSCTQIFVNLKFENAIAGILFRIVFMLMLIPAVYIMIITILEYFMVEKNNSVVLNEKPGRIPFIRLYYITLPIAAVVIAYVAASYPSYTYPDIYGVWQWVVNHEWYEWHTIGFMLFVKIFSLGGRWQFLTLVFQGIFLIYIYDYAIYLLYNALHSKKICKVYGIASAVIFTPLLYCGYMIKDTVYCMSQFLFVLGLFDCLMSEKITARHIFVFIISGIGTAIFRHAGWAGTGFALVALCVYRFVKKQDFVKLLCALLAIVLVGMVFINSVFPRGILRLDEDLSYVKYTVPLYLVGAVSNKVEDIPAEDVAVMEEIMPREQWNKTSRENKYWADKISRTYGDIGYNVEKLNDPETAAKILKLNFKWLFRYPKEYISSAFDITSILWEIGRPSDGTEWAPLEGGEIAFEMGDGGLKRTVSTSVTRTLSDMTFRNQLVNPVYWRGGLWLFALIFSAVVLLLKRRYKYLIVLSVPLITTALLFLSIPAQDPRYIIYLIEEVMFILVFALKTKNT